MSIKTREEANQYYNQVNKLIDEYTETHKIRPSKLGKYLKPGTDRSKKFLKRNNLSDVVGVERILSDVIEDRINMEEDGVLTFESYKYFESNDFKIDSMKECLYKGIDKADLKMEKALADYFDVNLGSIDVVDSQKHKFKIQDWKNDDWLCVIYSSEEFEVVKSNIFEYLFSELSSKKVEVIEGIKIDLQALIKENDFLEKIEDVLVEKKLTQIIADTLGPEWLFEEKFRNYFIWIS